MARSPRLLVTLAALLFCSFATVSFSQTTCPCVMNTPTACDIVVLQSPNFCSLEAVQCGGCVCDTNGQLTCEVASNQPYYAFVNPGATQGQCELRTHDIALCPSFTIPPGNIGGGPDIVTQTFEYTAQLDWQPPFVTTLKRSLCPGIISGAELIINTRSFGTLDIVNTNRQTKNGSLTLGIKNNLVPESYFTSMWQSQFVQVMTYTLPPGGSMRNQDVDATFPTQTLDASQQFIDTYNSLLPTDTLDVTFAIKTFNFARNSVIQNTKLSATGNFRFDLKCESVGISL